MITYFESLTGANCTVGGQTIISLTATEDMEADYDTASAICLAPGGIHDRGTQVQTVEGGVSTGLWITDDAAWIYSGRKTWRRRSGTDAYTHLPLVSYRLRRKGYLQARATISRATLGTDNYPPKFCTQQRMYEINQEINARIKAGELTYYAANRERGTWRPVAGAADIIRTVCGWVGLPVSFRVNLKACAEEYMPVGKTALAVCKEVASWSGASCHLNRSGTLVVYDWQQVYGQASSVPMPQSLLEIEEHQAVPSPTQVTVVGKGYKGVVVDRPAKPAGWSPSGIWRPAQPAATYISGRHEKAVEVTESIGVPGGGRHVEERIEINNYPLDPQLAQAIARERLARAELQALSGTYQGPAEGCQSYAPITHRIFSVTRTLNWTGSAYRYEITICGPRATMSWGSILDDSGWW